MRKAGLAFAPKAVLLLQNGWGSADEANAALPANVPAFSRIMMIGIERRSPTHLNVNVQSGAVRVRACFECRDLGIREATQGLVPGPRGAAILCGKGPHE